MEIAAFKFEPFCNEAEQDRVSQGNTYSTDCELLDLQVAGLQGFANTLGPKSLWRDRGLNPGLLLTRQML